MIEGVVAAAAAPELVDHDDRTKGHEAMPTFGASARRSLSVSRRDNKRRPSLSLLCCSRRNSRRSPRLAIPHTCPGVWLKRRLRRSRPPPPRPQPPPPRPPRSRTPPPTPREDDKSKGRRPAFRPRSSTGSSLRAFSASKRLARPATTWGALSTLSLIALARSEPLLSILAVFWASAPARSLLTGARCILTRRRRERSSSI